MHCGHPESTSFGQQEIAECGLAEAGGIFQHGQEHWLEFAGRTADDLQDLRGRRLLLQSLGKAFPRLAELSGACLELPFQLCQ